MCQSTRSSNLWFLREVDLGSWDDSRPCPSLLAVTCLMFALSTGNLIALGDDFHDTGSCVSLRSW